MPPARKSDDENLRKINKILQGSSDEDEEESTGVKAKAKFVQYSRAKPSSSRPLNAGRGPQVKSKMMESNPKGVNYIEISSLLKAKLGEEIEKIVSSSKNVIGQLRSEISLLKSKISEDLNLAELYAKESNRNDELEAKILKLEQELKKVKSDKQQTVKDLKNANTALIAKHRKEMKAKDDEIRSLSNQKQSEEFDKIIDASLAKQCEEKTKQLEEKDKRMLELDQEVLKLKDMNRQQEQLIELLESKKKEFELNTTEQYVILRNKTSDREKKKDRQIQEQGKTIDKLSRENSELKEQKKTEESIATADAQEKIKELNEDREYLNKQFSDCLKTLQENKIKLKTFEEDKKSDVLEINILAKSNLDKDAKINSLEETNTMLNVQSNSVEGINVLKSAEIKELKEKLSEKNEYLTKLAECIKKQKKSIQESKEKQVALELAIKKKEEKTAQLQAEFGDLESINSELFEKGKLAEKLRQAESKDIEVAKNKVKERETKCDQIQQKATKLLEQFAEEKTTFAEERSKYIDQDNKMRLLEGSARIQSENDKREIAKLTKEKEKYVEDFRLYEKKNREKDVDFKVLQIQVNELMETLSKVKQNKEESESKSQQEIKKIRKKAKLRKQKFMKSMLETQKKHHALKKKLKEVMKVDGLASVSISDDTKAELKNGTASEQKTSPENKVKIFKSDENKAKTIVDTSEKLFDENTESVESLTAEDEIVVCEERVVRDIERQVPVLTPHNKNIDLNIEVDTERSMPVLTPNKRIELQEEAVKMDSSAGEMEIQEKISIIKEMIEKIVDGTDKVLKKSNDLSAIKIEQNHLIITEIVEDLVQKLFSELSEKNLAVPAQLMLSYSWPLVLLPPTGPHRAQPSLATPQPLVLLPSPAPDSVQPSLTAPQKRKLPAAAVSDFPPSRKRLRVLSVAAVNSRVDGQCKLLVENLHPNTTTGSLLLFATTTVGKNVRRTEIHPVQKPRNPSDVRVVEKKFGVIQFESKADTDSAMKKLNQQYLHGNIITVKKQSELVKNLYPRDEETEETNKADKSCDQQQKKLEIEKTEESKKKPDNRKFRSKEKNAESVIRFERNSKRRRRSWDMIESPGRHIKTHVDLDYYIERQRPRQGSQRRRSTSKERLSGPSEPGGRVRGNRERSEARTAGSIQTRISRYEDNPTNNGGDDPELYSMTGDSVGHNLFSRYGNTLRPLQQNTDNNIQTSGVATDRNIKEERNATEENLDNKVRDNSRSSLIKITIENRNIFPKPKPFVHADPEIEVEEERIITRVDDDDLDFFSDDDDLDFFSRREKDNAIPGDEIIPILPPPVPTTIPSLLLNKKKPSANELRRMFKNPQNRKEYMDTWWRMKSS